MGIIKLNSPHIYVNFWSTEYIYNSLSNLLFYTEILKSLDGTFWQIQFQVATILCLPYLSPSPLFFMLLPSSQRFTMLFSSHIELNSVASYPNSSTQSTSMEPTVAALCKLLLSKILPKMNLMIAKYWQLIALKIQFCSSLW